MQESVRMSAEADQVARPARVRQPSVKRAKLLDAARHLFASQGFDATTTAEITRRAGVSEGVLFHQFATKRGIYDQLANDYGQACAAFLDLDAADGTHQTVVRGAFDFADRDPQLYRLFAVTGPKIDEFGTTPMSQVLVAAIEATLERDMGAGTVRRGDSRVMAELQFAIVDGAYRGWSHTGDPDRAEHYIAEAIHAMAAMLAPRPADG